MISVIPAFAGMTEKRIKFNFEIDSRPARFFNRVRVLYFLWVCDRRDTACGEGSRYTFLSPREEQSHISSRAPKLGFKTPSRGKNMRYSQSDSDGHSLYPTRGFGSLVFILIKRQGAEEGKMRLCSYEKRRGHTRENNPLLCLRYAELWGDLPECPQKGYGGQPQPHSFVNPHTMGVKLLVWG